MSIRVWVGLLAAGSFLLAIVIGGGAGVGISYASGVSLYEASTSILSILGAVGVLITYSLAVNPPASGQPGPLAGAGRRAVAWFIDFVLSVAMLTSVLALIPLIVEALRTGEFAWQFQRSQITATDWIVALLVIALSFIGMAYYWTLPVMRGGQTVGQCILGLLVVPVTSVSLSERRVWVRGLLQPFGPFLWLARLVSGKYWHDELANTKVVRVVARSSAAV